MPSHLYLLMETPIIMALASWRDASDSMHRALVAGIHGSFSATRVGRGGR